MNNFTILLKTSLNISLKGKRICDRNVRALSFNHSFKVTWRQDYAAVYA